MRAKYRQIAEDLEKTFPGRILEGHSRLPGEEELCRLFSCSRQTIRSALALLEEKRVIIRRKGSGTYITSGQLGRIALILPGKNEYIFPKIIHTITEAFAPYHYQVICYDTAGRVFRERALLEELLSDPPDGIIMEATGGGLPCICDSQLKKLEEKAVPFVYLNSRYAIPQSAVFISEDDRMAAHRLVHTLANAGCRHLLAVMRLYNSRSLERFAGLASACPEHGIELDEHCVAWLSEDEYGQMHSGLYDPLRTFLHGRIRPGSAIVCGNDEIAHHVLRLMAREGKRVPEDVSVAGFDNSYYCHQEDISLTSVSCEESSAAAYAADALLSLLTGQPVSDRLLPMTVHARMSTAKRISHSIL